MVEVIINGILTNLLYDILKSAIIPSVYELQNRTHYSQEECEKLVSLAGAMKKSSKISRSEITETLWNQTSLVKEFRDSSYKTNFAARLDYILSEMRKCNNEANVEWLAYNLNYASSDELRKYYQTNSEPTFEFIKDFAYKAGIEPNWLAYGENFQAFDTVNISLDQRLSRYIRENNVKSIYFLFTKASLSEYDNSEIIMVFQMNSLKYVTNRFHIPFGSYVGSGGRRTICNFYLFLRWLYQCTSCWCYSISIPNDLKESLVLGEMYGGIVKQYEVRNSNNLIEDFMCEIPPVSCEYTVNECKEIIKADAEWIKSNQGEWMGY